MTKFIYIMMSFFFASICFLLIEFNLFKLTGIQSMAFILFWLIIGENVLKDKK